MKLTEMFHDLAFYMRVTERGLVLVIMIGILTVRSIIRNKPVFS